MVSPDYGAGGQGRKRRGRMNSKAAEASYSAAIGYTAYSPRANAEGHLVATVP